MSSSPSSESDVIPPGASVATGPSSPSLFSRYKHSIFTGSGFLVVIVLGYYAYDTYTHEETDDAYVTGHLHNVSARISNVVTDVLVEDNQPVHKGDLLVKLDPQEYQAMVVATKSNYDVAQSNLKRLKSLIDSHSISPEDLEKANGTRDVDYAQYCLAQLQVDYTSITAPSDGYVGRKNVEIGNRVASGQTLMVVVEPDLWVVANFKETQLARMQIGQLANVSIDSIPDKVFLGKVNSFSPATGNEFALLPADNATGNFTKIVQRVPVKITLNPDSVRGYENRIRAGESAVVKVALTPSR